ncbi:hypothetical protein E3P81_03790 [Wallemia ichthyophaga]|nr:hypothetical protein E3P97_03783 [Wallemia ichthyophaga]TIB28294.1 hypothetical protein E3P85_03741 [Wallemia ichthyophaga]TIB43917.1 hypothetical protein E3P82_03780 [Wallemia ichthyophaga]TIB46120.1 hypothetical protein E3P81_03790 [Wallemia ichthyophaga]TIB48591.1 hypothetical protein E3P80_03784 [Wallemia ichthyophaga]
MSENAYLDFIINNISAQVDFLLTQGVLNASDARLIKLKLSNPSSNTANSERSGVPSSGLAVQPAPFNSQASLPTMSRRGSLSQKNNKESPLPSPPGPPQVYPTPATHHNAHQPQQISHPPPPPPPQAPMPAPIPALKKCVARWDYSGEASDLRLMKGDTINIIEEVNDDWWKGRSESTGAEGLFPSNRVERIGANPQLRSLPPAAPPSSTFGGEKEKDAQPPSYNGPPGISYGASTYAESYPQPGQQYPQPPAPPAAGPSTYVQQPEDPKKNNKFKKLGSTMGNSFAGGVGFGAGAGVVSSIFN